MKKLIIGLGIVLLVGCHSSSGIIEYDNSVEILSTGVDMSVYSGMDSTSHQFLETNVKQLIEFVKNKGTGVFFFGQIGCRSCHLAIPVVDRVAKDSGVIVYYINSMNIDNSDYQEFVSLATPILDTYQGEPTLFTPDLMVVKDGEFVGNYIGVGSDISGSLTSSQVDDLVFEYRKVLELLIDKE